MELTLPEVWPVSIQATFSIIGALALAIWISSKAFNKVMSRIDAIDEKMAHMEERNKRADAETEKVKTEQGDQRVAQAVMAQQLHSQGESIRRIDSGVQEILKFFRSQK